ncbi:uncharacterized protein LOC103469003 [Poecilia reticulata]|uniref:uncharacterized protein LOC103469003 n=1 Tax=Poecilia reticulata TaxID=8081 RepID=UPI0004A48A52|nr:PREDICTED: uncharacterized protein LOC103469003 [Poecilia reticulata]
MDDADALVRKVNKWVALQKECSRKLKNLADELEEATKAANVTKVVGSSVSVGGAAAMTAAGVLTLLTGGAALPVLAVVAGAGAVASGTGALTSVGSDVYSASKSKDIMEEAQKVLEELQSLEQEMKDLMKSLKRQDSSFCRHGGAAGGGDDDDDDGNVMEFVMRSMARQEGLELSSSIMIRSVFGLPHIDMFKRIKANDIILAGCLIILTSALIAVSKQGGKKVASSLGKKAASAAAGSVAGGAVGLFFSVPELVSDCQNLDNTETEASKTLRKNARTILTSAEETEKELQKIREALKKLVRIKFIIEKETRTRDEKRELIDHAINNTPYPEVKQWLRENAESDVFFHLVNLTNFIAQKLNEEAKKKKGKDREKKKIELVFLAHGSIVDLMIPARCLLPLPSITDVLLYSPWNCLLYPEAAYSIATGSIQPHHRQFGCTNPDLCPFLPAAHTSFRLPHSWNSMRNTGLQSVPIIMVSPVAKIGDPAFAAFIALAAHFGEPAANRYLIPYLAPWIGKVPFFIVTLAMSLVLFFSGYEATVHLAACLGKSPGNAVMQEEYLQWQYAYAVDNTGMTVPRESIRYIDGPVFNMFKAVFGDESPFF